VMLTFAIDLDEAAGGDVLRSAAARAGDPDA